MGGRVVRPKKRPIPGDLRLQPGDTAGVSDTTKPTRPGMELFGKEFF